MNTDKIEIGMQFKNYYKLCEVLDIKPSTNRSQQLKSISRYIVVNKIKGTQGYIVTDIYERPIPQKTRGRKRKYVPKTTEAPRHRFKNYKGGKYIEYEKKILLKNICDKGYLLCDRRELAYILGMCNFQYAENDYKVEDINEYSYGLRNIDFYYSSVIGAIIQGMLNSLINTDNLICIEEVVVYSKSGDIEYRVATANEYSLFSKYVEEKLNIYGIKDYRELYHPKQEQLVNAARCKKEIKTVIENELGWVNYARKMKITLSPDISSEELKVISECDIQDSKEKLNSLIIERIREYMLKKGQKLFNYNPDIENPITIGDKEYGVSRKAYEDFCSDLELIIDKYIRI